jgi:hypothetical protein
MASNSRPQPYRLKWPWTAPQIENADEMFEILYKRVYALEQKVNVSIAGTPGTGTASNSAILGLLADPAAGGGGSDDDVKLAPPGPAGPQGPIGPGVQAFFEMGNEEERLLPIPPIPPLPIIDGRAVAQAAAVATVATYTPGADASFLVSANVLVTTATTHNFTVTVAYTDEGNTARTLTLSFTLVAGGAFTTAVANGNGTVPYMGIPQQIRAKGGTAITIATTGTFTTVVYNVEGWIQQIAP